MTEVFSERLSSERISGNDDIVKMHLARYNFALPFVRSKTVLDIACGIGYGSNLMESIGQAIKVIGCDIDEDAILKAKETYKTYHIEFSVMDASKIKLESKQFDVITSFETIEHVPDWQSMILELKRVLKDDGVLLISTPNKTYPYENPFHLKEFYPDEFQNELLKHFASVEMFYQGAGEYFGKLSTMLHVRRFVKKVRSPKVFYVKTLEEIGKDRPITMLAVCKKQLKPEVEHE